MSSSLHNEKELLQLISEGDESAFRQVYDHSLRKELMKKYGLDIIESEEVMDVMVLTENNYAKNKQKD